MSENTIHLKRIELSGFKSIEKMDLELRSMNVLIGANGAGKSNLVSLFDFLNAIRCQKLRDYVMRSGGAEDLLYYGAKKTPRIEVRLNFRLATSSLDYEARLASTAKGSLFFESERAVLHLAESKEPPLIDDLGVGHAESKLDQLAESELFVGAVNSMLRRCKAFHFNDTSVASRMRRSSYLHDNANLHFDAGNLAAILYKIRRARDETPAYRRIAETIRQIAPWFDGFVLEPLEPNKTDVLLNWRDQFSDRIFGPHQLPDGALRAMALITLLLQPEEDLPSLIVIDEPELGLHPAAIVALAGLLKAVSRHSQVIIATQSVTLLEEFDAGDVIVVDREDGRSTFTRLDPERLKEWLEEYTLGELWQKNSIGGGPF